LQKGVKSEALTKEEITVISSLEAHGDEKRIWGKNHHA
jgi:hypothetical protein